MKKYAKHNHALEEAGNICKVHVGAFSEPLMNQAETDICSSEFRGLLITNCEADLGSGSGSKDHFASTRPQSESEVRAVLRASACGIVREI